MSSWESRRVETDRVAVSCTEGPGQQLRGWPQPELIPEPCVQHKQPETHTQSCWYFNEWSREMERKISFWSGNVGWPGLEDGGISLTSRGLGSCICLEGEVGRTFSNSHQDILSLGRVPYRKRAQKYAPGEAEQVPRSSSGEKVTRKHCARPCPQHQQEGLTSLTLCLKYRLT